eukprot:Rmarinus@m.17510
MKGFFSLLPEDCLIQVFSTLDIISRVRCTQVCRLWRRILDSEEQECWYHNDDEIADFSTVSHRVEDAFLINFLRKFKHQLKKINLSRCHRLTDEILPYLAQCTSLEDLSLSSCKGLSEEGIALLVMALPSLQHLHLVGMEAVTGQDLQAALLTKNLHTLDLSSHSTSRNDEITSLFLSDLSRNCSNLSCLKLSNCKAILPHGLLDIVSRAPLVDLDVSEIPRLYPHVLLQLVTFLAPRLEGLAVRGMWQLSDSGLRDVFEILQECPLRRLNLISCTSLESFASVPFPDTLEELRLSRVYKLEPSSVISLSKRLRLRVLSLEHCDNLRDEHLEEIFVNCADTLECLLVGYCQMVTGSFLASAMQKIKNRTLPLRWLDLHQHRQVSPSAIEQICMKCPNLHTLNLCYCEEITDDTLQVMARSPARHTLRSLDLSHCVLVTDLGILTILDHLYYLRSLRLFGLPKLTPVIARRISSGPRSPYLAEISLRYCTNLLSEPVPKKLRPVTKIVWPSK